jgi:hypothetical protein
VTYTRTQDDEEVSAVLEILEESEESSELYLTDTEDEDLDTRNDNSTKLAPGTIPLLLFSWTILISLLCRLL